MKLSKKLGVPDWLLFQFLPGTEAQIAISYKASDEMRVTFVFLIKMEIFSVWEV